LRQEQKDDGRANRDGGVERSDKIKDHRERSDRSFSPAKLFTKKKRFRRKA
jgi:hypothetical protein